MLKREELREAVPVLVNRLDEECADQSELFMEACELAAEARAEAKAAKHNLEQIRAEIHIKYRNGGLQTEIKLTDTAITALIDSHKDVIAVKKELRDSEKEAYLCESLVNAFDQKRSMLNNECDLHERQYRSTGEIRGRRSDIQDRIKSLRKAEHGKKGDKG